MIAPFQQAVLFQDEMRFGTRTDLKRRWTPQGHRPEAPVKIGYEFAYLYLALCPFTGWLYAMMLPYANKDTFTFFVKELNEQLQTNTLIIADRASFHQSTATGNTQLTLAHLPTACPELNPVERFFKEIRKSLANRIFDSLDTAYVAVENAVKLWQQQTEQLINLTLFPYIQNTQL